MTHLWCTNNLSVSQVKFSIIYQMGVDVLKLTSPITWKIYMYAILKIISWLLKM